MAATWAPLTHGSAPALTAGWSKAEKSIGTMNASLAGGLNDLG